MDQEMAPEAGKALAEVTAEQIVAALADAHPCVQTGDMWHECALCSATLPVKATDHDDDCPWRMAVEWGAAHGVDTYWTRDHLAARR